MIIIKLDCKQNSTTNFEQYLLRQTHAFLFEYENKICCISSITEVKLEVEKRKYMLSIKKGRAQYQN
jgi:hypothetical protein